MQAGGRACFLPRPSLTAVPLWQVLCLQRQQHMLRLLRPLCTLRSLLCLLRTLLCLLHLLLPRTLAARLRAAVLSWSRCLQHPSVGAQQQATAAQLPAVV